MSSLSVRVTPRAGRDAIEGFDAAGVLRVRTRAAPSDGAANEAVTRMLARGLGLAPRDVLLTSGAAGRLKRFEVPLDASEIAARLAGPPAAPPLPRS